MKTEELDKTPNKMIFIERDTALSKEEISERMEILRKACDMGDDLMAKEALRKVVPTYKTPEEMNQKVTLMQNKKETKAKEIKIAMS